MRIFNDNIQEDALNSYERCERMWLKSIYMGKMVKNQSNQTEIVDWNWKYDEGRFKGYEGWKMGLIYCKYIYLWML